MGFPLVALSGGYSLVAVPGLLIAVASLAAVRRLKSCGAWAQLLYGLRDLPRGIEPASPAFGRWTFTTMLPGKPCYHFFLNLNFHLCWSNILQQMVIKNILLICESESVSCSVMSNSFTIPWTVACQVPLSMELSRQEYWSGFTIPFSRRTFPTQGLNLDLLHCRQILYHMNH